MWTARWIWHERFRADGAFWTPRRADPNAVNVFSMLRRAFAWEGAGPVVARVAADSRYVLWVNGVEASRGPARRAPAWLPPDLVDLTPPLVQGENVVAALCRHYGEANCWWQPASPSGQLGMGSFLFQAGGPGFTLISDRSWKARA